MEAWFTFLCLKIRRVCLLIHFAAPPELLVVLGFMRTIALDVFGTLDSAGKGCVSLLPAIFALGYTWVHVSPSDSSDISANIKAPIDGALSFASALIIPNVNPYNRHV